eukprot:3394959-Pyramimonas_sp.AAC.1
MERPTNAFLLAEGKERKIVEWGLQDAADELQAKPLQASARENRAVFLTRGGPALDPRHSGGGRRRMFHAKRAPPCFHAVARSRLDCGPQFARGARGRTRRAARRGYLSSLSFCE